MNKGFILIFRFRPGRSLFFQIYNNYKRSKRIFRYEWCECCPNNTHQRWRSGFHQYQNIKPLWILSKRWKTSTGYINKIIPIILIVFLNNYLQYYRLSFNFWLKNCHSWRYRCLSLKTILFFIESRICNRTNFKYRKTFISS